jgi:hypothetical protein
MLIESRINNEGETVSTLISSPNINLIKDLLATEAIIEKGVSIVLPHRDITQEEIVIPNSNDQNNQYQMPYLYNGRAFYPVSEMDQLVELYKYMKKFSAISDNLDIRARKELMEKIQLLSDNIFYEQTKGKEEADLKKMIFIVWNIIGITRTMFGDPLIGAVLHLCSLLSIDFKTLARIIMSSTISEEKKQFILENIQKNYLNLNLTKEDWYVWPYARLDKELNDSIKIASRLNR